MIELLPFQFLRLDSESVLITNDGGDFCFLPLNHFPALLNEPSSLPTEIRYELESKHFLADSIHVNDVINMLATKYRSRKQFILDFTTLHMMVITVRCNHKCNYCQVSSVDEDAVKYDMTPATARKVVDCILESPSKHVKIEFQGGEPLLNWEALREAVMYAEKNKTARGKEIEFVVCTNLTAMDDDKLSFIAEHKINISTSLDGPKYLHDKHRLKRSGLGSYDDFIRMLDICRNKVGVDNVSALMTTSVDSLTHPVDIIDEYVRLGFTGIFLRPLNPFGAAALNSNNLGYTTDQFLLFYKQCIGYIIELNLKGVQFSEFLTRLLLKRILTSYPTGFVDLQFPAGAGISGVIYDYNGDVYPADEARMLARMGDTAYRMGNVFDDTYKDIFGGSVIRGITAASCPEVMPSCAYCAFKPYCGADPIRSYLETKDIKCNKPAKAHCSMMFGLFCTLFDCLRDKNTERINIFQSWSA